MTRDILVAPSILSADFANLEREISEVEAGGADWIHVDVMDGRFVPNLTIGPPVVGAIRRVTALPLDVHLMIESPDHLLPAFLDAGADLITVHAEACVHLQRTLSAIRAQGAKAGVALDPHTPLGLLDYVLDDLDLILIMTVNPGFGGQTFLSGMLRKIEAARAMVGDKPIDIEVDGGISPANVGLVTAAGANVVVAGTAVFGRGDRAEAIASLRANAGA